MWDVIGVELSEECILFLHNSYPSVDTILQDEFYLKLKKYIRHNFTNTYDHSIRVAVGAAIIAEWLHTDIESAIKVALLHDMCFVNIDERKTHGGFYAFYHPVEACENAEYRYGLTEIEKNAIKSHMFPLAIRIPMSRVALALTLSDKVIAIYEGLYFISLVRRCMCSVGMNMTHHRIYGI